MASGKQSPTDVTITGNMTLDMYANRLVRSDNRARVLNGFLPGVGNLLRLDPGKRTNATGITGIVVKSMASGLDFAASASSIGLLFSTTDGGVRYETPDGDKVVSSLNSAGFGVWDNMVVAANGTGAPTIHRDGTTLNVGLPAPGPYIIMSATPEGTAASSDVNKGSCQVAVRYYDAVNNARSSLLYTVADVTAGEEVMEVSNGDIIRLDFALASVPARATHVEIFRTCSRTGRHFFLEKVVSIDGTGDLSDGTGTTYLTMSDPVLERQDYLYEEDKDKSLPPNGLEACIIEGVALIGGKATASGAYEAQTSNEFAFSRTDIEEIEAFPAKNRLTLSDTGDEFVTWVQVRGAAFAIMKHSVVRVQRAGPALSTEQIGGAGVGTTQRSSVFKFQNYIAWMGSDSFFVMDVAGGLPQSIGREIWPWINETIREGYAVYGGYDPATNTLNWFTDNASQIPCGVSYCITDRTWKGINAFDGAGVTGVLTGPYTSATLGSGNQMFVIQKGGACYNWPVPAAYDDSALLAAMTTTTAQINLPSFYGKNPLKVKQLRSLYILMQAHNTTLWGETTEIKVTMSIAIDNDIDAGNWPNRAEFYAQKDPDKYVDDGTYGRFQPLNLSGRVFDIKIVFPATLRCADILAIGICFTEDPDLTILKQATMIP